MIVSHEGRSFSEKLYLYFNPRHTCPYCGGPAKYRNFNIGYATYCGLSCRSKHTRDKAKQTCLERYGDAHYNNRDKAKQTSLEKYGVESWNVLPEKIEKTKQTCLRRFGHPCSFQSEKVQDKYHKTCLKKYGKKWYTSTKEMVEKSKQTCLERYGVTSAMQNPAIKNKLKQTCRKKYGHPWGPVGHSKKEDMLAMWIKSHGLDVIQNFSNEYISEIDIYIPSLQIGIEFNGIYWHSNKHKKPKYHMLKTQMCYKNGIKLYHIWEHWDELDVYEFVLHILNIKPSIKNFDSIFYRDKNLKHIDIHPELCESNIKLKRRMYKSYIYYDSGVMV